jgi:hypothetical protein
MKSILILILFCFGLGINAQNERFKKGGGQPDKEEKTQPTQTPVKEETIPFDALSFKDKLVYGGGFGLSFGNTTQILLSPQVGYRVTKKLITGVGFLYNYTRINNIFNPGTGRFEPIDFQNTVYGPNVYASYFLSDKFYGQSQFEVLNFDDLIPINTNPGYESTNLWSSVWWVEAGYLTRFNNGSFAQFGIRANLLHGNPSPYLNWWMPTIAFFF